MTISSVLPPLPLLVWKRLLRATPRSVADHSSLVRNSTCTALIPSASLSSKVAQCIHLTNQSNDLPDKFPAATSFPVFVPLVFEARGTLLRWLITGPSEVLMVAFPWGAGGPGYSGSPCPAPGPPLELSLVFSSWLSPAGCILTTSLLVLRT